MKSQNLSNDDVDLVINCSRRVLSIFQNFKYHNELCERCVRFIEHAIKILGEIKNLSNNKKVKIIESNEYSHFNNLIFDIEFYLIKYDQRTAIQSEVRESVQNFAFTLENCIDTFQRVYEVEKTKKINGWNPSVIGTKVKSIGKLISLTKESEPIKEEIHLDFEEENPNRLIIQQELIISTGIHRGVNNIRKGNFISEEVAEKYIGSISKKSHEFSRFQKEVMYIKNLSRDCKNILSVSGYLERNGRIWIVEEWAEYNLLDYLRNNLNLDWRIKLAIARGIGNALNYIHNVNLLHYNVKIDSVLLNYNLEPKLDKFGKDSDDCIFLKSFQSLKHSCYTAPEVKRDEKYTSSSEVYSFGIILWKIATQDCQSDDEFDEQKRYADGAPTNYLTLVEKALNKEPHNRPTMQEMFDTLYQLESSYNIRCQKSSTRDMTNTNSIISIISNSSEDSPNLNDSTTSTSDDDDTSTSISSNNDENVEIERAIKLHEKRQYSKAFKIFNECNKRNPSSVIAKYWLGLYYYKGYHRSSKSSKSLQQSIKLSLKYFGEAARLNHPDAQYYYSRILLNNPPTDCEKNRFQIALEFLKKASDQNHLASMRWLGKIMGKGEFGCKRDVETSKILTDRSRRLSAESRNVSLKGNVNQVKSKTTTTSKPVSTYNQTSKRRSTLCENTIVVKSNKTKNRYSSLF